MDNKMKIELNRDQIKYIAVFTMLLNHVANIFLQPGTFACEALKDIGYFTAPVMCWFLVEGYRYTRSVKKYAGRLLIFAVISQLPYYLAFARNHLAPWYTLNMIFTLFLCLCLMIAEEKISDPGKKSLVVLGIIAVSSICDWAILAPLYTLWFYRAGEDPKRRKKAFFIAALVFAICIRETIPSCILAPPEQAKIMTGSFSSVARSTMRVIFSPTTCPILLIMNRASQIPMAVSKPLMVPFPVTIAS